MQYLNKSFSVPAGYSNIHSCVKNSVPVEDIDGTLVEITENSPMKCKVCGTVWYYDNNGKWKELR